MPDIRQPSDAVHDKQISKCRSQRQTIDSGKEHLCRIRQKLAGFEQKQPVRVKLPPSLPIPDESCLPDRYDVFRLGMGGLALNESIVAAKFESSPSRGPL